MSTPTVPVTRTRAAVAAIVDHTLLRPDMTRADLTAMVAEAQDLGVLAICVPPTMLPVEAGSVRVATVCGFPSGQHHSAVKAAEAAQAVRDGAHEIDMVMNLGAAKAGAWDVVLADILAVRLAAPAPTLLKVIIESAVLSDEEIVAACEAAVEAGADLVKTSTGFHPAGGATPHTVALMARTVAGRAGVKASGGLRTGAQALAMIAAGATRLGLSGTRAVLDSLDLADAAEPVAAVGQGGY